MAQTPTQNAIAKISRDLFTKHLKALGFKKTGSNLYREHEDVFHVIKFQTSQHNSSESGKFTLNLIVTSPSMYSLCLGKPFPSNPGAADYPLSERIGLVMPMPRRDIWWDVSSEENLEAVSEDICAKVVQHGLAFFAMYANGIAILKRIRSWQHIPLHGDRDKVHAILAKEAGFEDEARKVLQDDIKRLQRHIDSARELARKLDLDLS